MFYNTLHWTITTICTCLVKNSIPKPKNSSWRKEYIAFINCIAHFVSLKPCVRNLQVKTHIGKKSTIFYLPGYVFFRLFYSSWAYIDLHDLCINFNVFVNMIYMIFVILVVLITFKVDLLKLLRLIKPSFEFHCLVHTFHICVLNNGVQYHNTISFKILAYHSWMNYNMSKQEQYASCINDYLLVVQT